MPLTKLQQELIEHLLVKADTGMSDVRWCELLGVPHDTVKSWLKRPEFKAALEVAKRDFDEQQSHFGRKAWNWSVETCIVNYEKAEKAYQRASASDKVKLSAEMRLWMDKIQKETAQFASRERMIDYSGFTDEELWEEIVGRELVEGEAWTESTPLEASSPVPEPSTSVSGSVTALAIRREPATQPHP